MDDEDAYCPGCGSMGNDECKKDCDRANEAILKVPYTYTLPQHFIEDKEVPTRWRVWAVINGFFIGGQYCWASNEWIASKVKSHKDTVSQAVKELESLRIIRCERGARSRKIYPMIGANAYQWSASAPISDRHQRLSISVSNSEKEFTSALDAREIVIVSDNEEKPKKDTKITKEYDSLIFWLDGLTGVRTFQKAKAYTALASARSAEINKTRLKERAEELLADPFYQEKGLNWAMVVSSFNRKA